jgi:class 3 adenylate cyclase
VSDGAAFSIEGWLEELGLGEYAPAFIENHIDRKVLSALTAEDLRELGVQSIGHRRRIQEAAAQLGVAPAAVPARAEPSLQRRQITVLFCDLVGSTEMSAREDPEDLRDFLNAYRQALADTIERYNGLIAQYLGDGVMAYFGYPAAREYDAEYAVGAALAILERIGELPSFGGQVPRVRMGIATGLTVIAQTPAGLLPQEATATGEPPNLAARLQALAPPNGIIIAPATRELIGDLFECEDLGLRDLKGFDAPVPIWRVVRESPAKSRFDALRVGRRRAELVGRVGELAWLRDRLAAARQGAGQVIVVRGEGGFGKSRLVGQVVDELSGAGSERLVLQCSPYNQATPFHPIRSYIERVTGVGPGIEPFEARRRLTALLARAGLVSAERLALVAQMLHLKGIDPKPLEGLASQEVRGRMLKAVAALLEAIAVQTSVMVVEDLHWIDPSTSEVLASLAAVIPTLPVILIATARPGPLPGWIDATGTRHIQLDRLDVAETRRLVAAIAAPVVLQPALLEAIVARSDGVPIYAEELTRGFLESGSRKSSESDFARIPSTLTESLLARLDGLEFGRDIAPLAAVIGREFPISLLNAVCGEAERAARGIRELLDAGVLVAGHSRFGEAIAFRHILVREAAYQLLPRRERVRLHERLVERIQADFPLIAEGAPHILAIHLTEAGHHERAIVEWEKAGSDADRRSAYKEAVSHFERAVDLTLKLEACAERDRSEVQRRMNLIALRLAAHGFGASDVQEEIETVTTLSQRIGGSSSIVPALALKWLVLVTANWSAVEGLTRQMLALAEHGSDVDRLIAYRLGATTHIFRGEFAAGAEMAQRFMSLYVPEVHAPQLARVGPSQHATMAMVGLAECFTIFEDKAPAAHWQQRALESAHASQDIHTQCSALVFAGCFLSTLTGDLENLARFSDELRHLTMIHEVPFWRGHAELFFGLSLLAQEREEEGFLHARRGVFTLRALNAYSNIWYVLYALACHGHGRLEEGLEVLEWARPAMDAGVAWLKAEYLRARGHLHLGLGAPLEEVRADFETALRTAEAQGAALFAGHARAALKAISVDRVA